MEPIKRRPASAFALVASLIWIAICVWEQYFAKHNGSYNALPGRFYGLLDVVQWSALGVVGLAVLALLVERVWEPAAAVTPKQLDP